MIEHCFSWVWASGGEKLDEELLEDARSRERFCFVTDHKLSNALFQDPKTFAEKNNERMDKAEILEFAVDYIKDLKIMQYGTYMEIQFVWRFWRSESGFALFA